MRHFLDLSDAGGDAIAALINDAQERKGAPTGPRGRRIAMHRSPATCWG